MAFFDAFTSPIVDNRINLSQRSVEAKTSRGLNGVLEFQAGKAACNKAGKIRPAGPSR
jgi:hypothetical protein